MANKPVTVDLLHPTVVRAFTNWGYISFFGCIAALVTLLFFAIGQVKRADESKQHGATNKSAAPGVDFDTAAVGGSEPTSIAQATTSIAHSYWDSQTGFGFSYGSLYRLLPNVTAKPTSTITTGMGLLKLESSLGFCPDECFGLQVKANRMTKGEFDYWRGGGIGYDGKVERRTIQGQEVIILTSREHEAHNISFYRNGYVVDIESVVFAINGQSYTGEFDQIFDEILSTLRFN